MDRMQILPGMAAPLSKRNDVVKRQGIGLQAKWPHDGLTADAASHPARPQHFGIVDELRGDLGLACAHITGFGKLLDGGRAGMQDLLQRDVGVLASEGGGEQGKIHTIMQDRRPAASDRSSVINWSLNDAGTVFAVAPGNARALPVCGVRRTSGDKCSGRRMVPSDPYTNNRCTSFFNCRTLPGQSAAVSTANVSGAKRKRSLLIIWPSSFRKCRAIMAISSRRSRNGGKCKRMMLSR